MNTCRLPVLRRKIESHFQMQLAQQTTTLTTFGFGPYTVPEFEAFLLNRLSQDASAADGRLYRILRRHEGKPLDLIAERRLREEERDGCWSR
eukprot:jgi/Chlat1/29/ChrspC231209S00911